MSKAIQNMTNELAELAAGLEAMLAAPQPAPVRAPEPTPEPEPVVPLTWTYVDATAHVSITLTAPRRPIHIIDGRPYVRIGKPYKPSMRESFRIGQYMARYGK